MCEKYRNIECGCVITMQHTAAVSASHVLTATMPAEGVISATNNALTPVNHDQFIMGKTQGFQGVSKSLQETKLLAARK